MLSNTKILSNIPTEIIQFIIPPNLTTTEENEITLTSRYLNTLFQPRMKKAHSATQLLQYVSQGNLIQVKKILDEAKSPNDLLIQKSKVTDPSGRKFEKISPYLYALWTKDILMLKLMQKYLPITDLLQLIQEHESECKPEYVSRHGTYFSLTRLCNALKNYIEHSAMWTDEEGQAYWRREVGGAQYALPAHIVNLYCHPRRVFTHNPEFTFEETIVPRFDTLSDGTSWYDVNLGETYAISRGESSAWKTNKGAGDWLAIDLEVMAAFSKGLDEALNEWKENLIKIANQNFLTL